jgi:hypothetical protein
MRHAKAQHGPVYVPLSKVVRLASNSNGGLGMQADTAWLQPHQNVHEGNRRNILHRMVCVGEHCFCILGRAKQRSFEFRLCNEAQLASNSNMRAQQCSATAAGPKQHCRTYCCGHGRISLRLYCQHG